MNPLSRLLRSLFGSTERRQADRRSGSDRRTTPGALPEGEERRSGGERRSGTERRTD